MLHIDKASSAELPGAINSIFSWYKSSTIRYAFLKTIAAIRHPLNLYSQVATCVRS